MRIGVFDSGLGGLAIAQAIIRRLPQYDYLYLGDTKRVPYGNRSQATIHEFVSEALNYLYLADCQLVILACNTASAEALRKSQQEYLPAHYPDRRVLGVIIPTVEAAFEAGPANRIGVLATQSTVDSGAYNREVSRLAVGCAVTAQPAPLLVPLIENDGLKYVDPILDDYLIEVNERGIERLVLGCTHYCLLKEQIREKVNMPVISQDEVIPEKLADYLIRHPEIESKLGATGERVFQVTDLTSSYERLARRMYGEAIRLEKVDL
jgi:glutamate racemase